jgi:hypothetical protein
VSRTILKTVQPFFQKLWDREKTAEIRKNDRHFQIGECLELRKWYPEPNGGDWSRSSIVATISDITTHEDFPDGLQPGYVMLSLTNLINCIDQPDNDKTEIDRVTEENERLKEGLNRAISLFCQRTSELREAEDRLRDSAQ